MSKKIAATAALLIVVILITGYLQLIGLELPPSLLAPARYEPAGEEERIAKLNALSPNAHCNYKSAVDAIIDKNTSPESLAILLYGLVTTDKLHLRNAKLNISGINESASLHNQAHL